MSDIEKPTICLTTKQISPSHKPDSLSKPKVSPYNKANKANKTNKTKAKDSYNGKSKRQYPQASRTIRQHPPKSRSPTQPQPNQSQSQATQPQPQPTQPQPNQSQSQPNQSQSQATQSQSQATQPQSDATVEHPLENTWVLWYHDGKSDWSLESYRYIWEFSTIEDFWRLYNNLPSVSNTFIFLMKKGHPPIWEVPENIKGGSWLFKFPKKVADREWLKLSLYLIGETLSEDTEHLIGLSVSPKNYNVVMRVWNDDNESCYNKLKFPPEIARYKPLYKVFQEYQETEKQEAKTVIVS